MTFGQAKCLAIDVKQVLNFRQRLVILAEMLQNTNFIQLADN